MTYYDERSNLTLLANGYTAVAEVNGIVVTAWPAVVEFGPHRLEISLDGTLRLVHPGPLSENPEDGQSTVLGEFTYRLADGGVTSSERTATVQLNGVPIAPLSMSFLAAPSREGATAGELLGILEAVGTAPISYQITASDIPIKILANEIRSTAPILAGTHDFSIRAENAEGVLEQNFSVTLQRPMGTIFRGQRAPADAPGPLGGELDFITDRDTILHPTGSGVWRYVDGSVASSGDGLSPVTAYKTIQEAVDAHQAGDTILVEPGIYPERLIVNFGQNRATETDRVKLCRRGPGKVEVTATDALGGWSAAASGDADNNPNWANLWKVTVSNTRTVPLYASMLMQNGVAAFMRVSGDSYTTTAQMFSQNDIAKFYTNANAGISGSLSGSVLTLTSASLFGGYASGDLDDARVIAQYTPGNNGQQCPILTHTPDNNEVACAFTRPAYGDGIALMNVAKDIDAPGQWAYKDNGDGTSIIYFWPYNSSQMNLIRLTARTDCVNFGAAEHWTFYGIDATGAGGTSQEQGLPWWSNQHNIYDRPGLIFEECRAYAYVNSEGWNIGFDIEQVPGCKMFHCEAVSGTNGKGLSMIESPGGWIDQCKVEDMGNTGVNLSKAIEQVFSYCAITNIASIHGNGMSLYQGTREVVVWGNIIDTRGAIGITHQESANLHFGMNRIIAPEGEAFGHRGLENNGTNPARRDRVIFSGEIVLLNNSVVPWATATGSENVNATITCKTTNVTHHCCNSVTFGGIEPTDGGSRTQPTQNGTAPNDYYTTVGTYEDNIVLGGNLNDPSDTFFQSGNNSHESVIADLFADYANGDYSPKAAGPLDGVGGDHSALLPSGAWIDWFDFDRDLNGTPFDWTTGAPLGSVLP